MTDIITAPDMATTWQPTLTRKEAKGRGIPRKSYRRLVSWAQMVVHYHQSEGTPRPLWEGTATHTEDLVGPDIDQASSQLARELSKSTERQLNRADRQLDSVETQVRDLKYPRSVSGSESDIKYSAQTAEHAFDRLSTKITTDEAAGRQHHRRTPKLVARWAPMLPWLEAIGLFGFIVYFLDVPLFAPWTDPLAYTLAVTIVVVLIFSQTLLVHTAGKAQNTAREAEEAGNRQAAEDGRGKRNIFLGLASTVAIGITAGLILRGIEALGNQAIAIRGELIFLAALAGLLMPIMTYLSVAMDGSRVSRERDSLAKSLDRDLRNYRKAEEKVHTQLRKTAATLTGVRTKHVPAALGRAEQTIIGAAHRQTLARVLIGGLVGEPSRTTCRVDDDHTVELFLGTPNARSVDTLPVTERLVRAAELDARRVNLNAELDALPAHPWTTREEETWQPAAARADITTSRRIVIDTLSQPG